MKDIKVYYAKTPPKSRVKQPGGFVFSYRWKHVAQMVKEARDKAQDDNHSVRIFEPNEYEITGVCVSDDDVTFYMEEKKK